MLHSLRLFSISPPPPFHALEGKVSVGLPKHSVSCEGGEDEARGGEGREGKTREELDWRPQHTCKVGSVMLSTSLGV